MRRLIRANVVRLWKDKLFWLCVAIMAVLGVAIPLDNLKWHRVYHEVIYTESIMFGAMPILSVMLAAFCGLFVGTEYSDGAMRNKLIVGNGRKSIFAANFLSCAFASVLICAAYIVPSVIASQILLDGFKSGAGEILGLLTVGLLTAAACAALFNCVAMLIHSRSACIAALLLGVCALLVVSMLVNGRLDEPPMRDIYEAVEVNGAPLEVKTVVNPSYISGAKRRVYQFLADFLPTGQAIQLCNGEIDPESAWRMPVYSMVVILGSCAVGMWIFQKKDIK